MIGTIALDFKVNRRAKVDSELKSFAVGLFDLHRRAKDKWGVYTQTIVTNGDIVSVEMKAAER